MNDIDLKNLYKSMNFSQDVNEIICHIASKNRNLMTIYKIGSSVLNTPILAINVGFGKYKILINATHHARELINTLLLLDQIQYIANLYEHNCFVKDINIKKLLKEVTFVFVPLVNPDGADLVLRKKSYECWKANIRGVDLNRNYPTKYPSTDIVNCPSSKNFGGYLYFSEPEVCALRDLSEYCLFEGSISYHSSGEEIYWQFNQDEEDFKRDFEIAKIISKETGYKLIEEDKPNEGSGYKDWFIENYHKPSLTMEVSPYVGERKVPIENYSKIFAENKNIPLIFAQKILQKLPWKNTNKYIIIYKQGYNI